MDSSKSSSGHDSIALVLAALVANGIVMIAKFAVAAISGSAAMFAEGVHSAADTGNQALLLVGNHRMKRPPDVQHPFGYGQEIYFWGLIVAMVLFGLGGGVSCWEGVTTLWHGEYEPHDPTWSYIVLAIAFVAEGAALIYSIIHFRRRYPGVPLMRALRDSKDPRLFIPLVEDAAAQAGVVVAFLGIFLAQQLGLPALDPIASVLIGLILIAVAVFLAWENRALLIGERMDEQALAAIAAIVADEPHVERVRRLLTMHLSPNEILAAIDVQLADGAPRDGTNVAVLLERIERRIQEHDPRIGRIFIEPVGPASAS